MPDSISLSYLLQVTKAEPTFQLPALHLGTQQWDNSNGSLEKVTFYD
jgi:hypothetical protein